MRNGNFLCSTLLVPVLVRSYRTYEEWKLSTNFSIITPPESSYRTYEEWKPLA